ncbi:MAG: tRNA lysidine(34) synthetase TilS [Paracoccaceae bacterium]
MSVTDGATGADEDAGLLLAATQAFVGTRSEGAAPLPVVVAVSGGGDSMALLHLMHRAAPLAGYAVQAVTVDHGLRPEAAAEAAGVACFCATLGIPHATLRWGGRESTGNLMDQARRARLRLIGNWAVSQAIGHVVLGHTADDQAESFLMNLSRAAGLDGLSGMRAEWQSDGTVWSRPLLAHSRASLRAYLRRQGVAWVDDPSNDNDRFARVKARRALKALGPLGITVQRLNMTIANLAAAQGAVLHATAKAAEGIEERAGALRVPVQLLLTQPAEIQRRLLIGMVRWMNGADYPPREAKVSQLQQALHAGRDATLGGVRFRHRDECLVIMRESRAAGPAASLGAIWDHRWRVTGPGQAQVRALGADGLAQTKDWRAAGIERDVAVVTPGVWVGDQLVAAPLLGFGDHFTATLTAAFGLFLISH